MQTFISLLIILCAIILQLLVGPLVWFGNMPLPLTTGAMLFYAINAPLAKALCIAFTIGMIHDALGNIPLGYTSILFCITTGIISRYRDILMPDSALTGAFLGPLVTLVLQTLTALLLISAELASFAYAGTLLLKIAGSGLLAIVSTPLLFLTAAAVHRSVVYTHSQAPHDIIR